MNTPDEPKSPRVLHVPRLVLSHHSHEAVHGGGTLGRFNSWLAVKVTKTVGTMWAAYLFILIGLVSLPQAFTAFSKGDMLTAVAWLSQSFLQLVLLPIIIVGQNVIQASTDARAEADHETLTAVHQLTVEVHAINEAQTAILRQLQAR
ncbi:MAG TPA: hypothetical protein VIO37_03270 [Candidatus Dormibacteraeota bacterium]